MLISIRQRDNQNESSCTFCMHLPVKLCTDRPSLVENSSNISPRPLHPCPSWTNRRNHLPDSTVYVDEPSKKQEHLRRQPQPVRSHLIELVSATIDIDSGFQPTCSQRSKRLHRKWGDGLLRLRLSQTGDQLDFNGHTPYYSYTVCWHWADSGLIRRSDHRPVTRMSTSNCTTANCPVLLLYTTNSIMKYRVPLLIHMSFLSRGKHDENPCHIKHQTSSPDA